MGRRTAAFLSEFTVHPGMVPSHISMHNEETHARAGSLRRLSLEELAAYAIQEKLIDAFETFDDRAVITQGDHRFVLPPRQATTFLIGMLRGRSWYVEDRPSEPPITTYPSAPPLSAKEPSTSKSSPPPLDTTLRSLLAFTYRVGIIEGYEPDDESRSVRIDIPSCSTSLSYAEAVSYLFDCIQHEMRTVRQRNTPGGIPSTRTNER